MAIQSADKIFVDVNDEINFVVEKVLSSSSQNIIIAVPQNALIVSSLVSMKILAKQIAKSKKLVILVTEDKFGMQLAERAGMVSTSKVSKVSPEMWEVAQIKKQTAKGEIEDKKEELLTDRGILPVKEVVASKSTSKKKNLEPVIEEEEEVLETEEDPEEEVEEEVKEEETFKAPIQRIRRQGKMLTLSGIQVFAGGDISNIGKTKSTNGDKIAPKRSINDMEEEQEPPIKKEKRAGGFTGRDWTSATRAGSKKDSGKKILPNIVSFDKDSLGFSEGGAIQKLIRSKSLWAGLAATGIVLAVAIYVLAFVLSSVEIRLELRSTDVPVEQQVITADTSYLDVDAENFIVPARLISVEASGSISGNASGEGSRGDKAAGLIDIWNKSTEEIVLDVGTKLTSAQSGLVYVLLEKVTIPAGSENGAIVDPGTVETRIEAKKIGEDHNIESSDDSNVSLKISGFATGKIEGKRFLAISGGTSEDFVAVSKADVNKRKKVLEGRIETDAMALLRGEVETNEVLLVNSEIFKEQESTVTPDIGEEAEKFDIDLIIDATAIVVQREHLDLAIAALIEQSQDSTIDFEVDSLSGSTIENVERAGEIVTFNVSSRGSITGKINEEEIKRDIAGLTLEEAKGYLDFEVPEVENSRIIYSPGLVPSFLRFVPTDSGRILIVISQ